MPTIAERARHHYEQAVPECVRKYVPHHPTAKQAAFVAYEGREALFGGGGGSGKTDALMMAALRYVCIPGYAAFLFRQSYPQLSRPGQFIDRANEWLTATDARHTASEKRWTFPSGAILQFGYVERDADRYGWAGPELQFAGWDELTNWATDKVYRFISFSRARRPSEERTDLPACLDCGRTLADVPLRARAGTNPGGPGHDWVMEQFVQPWQTAKDAGELGRVKLRHPFFPARLVDNPHIDRDEYRAGLAELDPVDRARIEDGDWAVREKGGMFERAWFPIVADYPRDAHLVRYWDSAATEPNPQNTDPDWTAGCLMAMKDGQFWIVDINRFRESDLQVERRVAQQAALDGTKAPIWIEQEPGASGKHLIAHWQRRILPGFAMRGDAPSGSKVDRARPLSSAAEAGNVFLVRGEWNAEFLAEMEAFPQKGWHDDQCLVGDTIIETPGGRRRLDEIRPGNLVLGASGWTVVLWAGVTGHSDTVTVAGLTGTPNHPVWAVGRGWTPLSNLGEHDVTLNPTGPNTQPNAPSMDGPRRCWPILPASARALPPGIDPPRDGPGIASTLYGQGSADVFNLATGDGTFFANGVLVHNCDAASGAHTRLAEGLRRRGSVSVPGAVAAPGMPGPLPIDLRTPVR